jgi:hypothetical protein
VYGPFTRAQLLTAHDLGYIVEHRLLIRKGESTLDKLQLLEHVGVVQKLKCVVLLLSNFAGVCDVERAVFIVPCVTAANESQR